MLESSSLWLGRCAVLAGLAAVACTVAEPQPASLPAPAVSQAPATPARDESALAEEAKAMLAQAETDVQRARARRALWLKAWEDLVAARRAVASSDNAAAIALARDASDLAQLGLEQLAYPAVK